MTRETKVRMIKVKTKMAPVRLMRQKWKVRQK